MRETAVQFDSVKELLEVTPLIVWYSSPLCVTSEPEAYTVEGAQTVDAATSCEIRPLAAYLTVVYSA